MNSFPTHAPQQRNDGTIDPQIITNIVTAIFAMCFGSILGIGLLMHTQTRITAYMHSINNDLNRVHPYFLKAIDALYYIVSSPDIAWFYLHSSYYNLRQKIQSLCERRSDSPILKAIERLKLHDVLEPTADIPRHLTCPIDNYLLTEPVLIPSGIIYNLPSIKRWYAAGSSKDPVTNATLTANERKILIPNQSKIAEVLAFLHETAQQRRQQLTSPAIPITANPTSLAEEAAHRRQATVGEMFLAQYTRRLAATQQSNNAEQAPNTDPEQGLIIRADNRAPLLNNAYRG